jgi:hypothetical protein
MTDPIGTDGEWWFDDLRALYINCTLKRSPERSHTQGLIDRSRSIMEQHGVAVDELRAAGAGRRHPGAVRPHLAGGGPAYGNQRSERDAGCRFDFENPEHR